MTCPDLQTIVLPSTTRDADVYSIERGSQFRCLQNISISGSWEISGVGVNALCSGLEFGLKKLSLKQCNFVSVAEIQNVLGCHSKSLEILDLSCCPVS